MKINENQWIFLDLHGFSSISSNMLANCVRCHSSENIFKLAYVRDLEALITIPYTNINIIPVVPGLRRDENPKKSWKSRIFRRGPI